MKWSRNFKSKILRSRANPSRLLNLLIRKIRIPKFLFKSMTYLGLPPMRVFKNLLKLQRRILCSNSSPQAKMMLKKNLQSQMESLPTVKGRARLKKRRKRSTRSLKPSKRN
jgi:hypothetical protein